MSGFGSGSIQHSNYEVKVYTTLWTGKGAANCVAVEGKGVASFAYNSGTGLYLLTLTDWPGELMDVEVKNHRASGSAPLVGSPVWATVDKSAKTIPVEVWDMATPSKTNLVDSTNVVLKLTFKKSL